MNCKELQTLAAAYALGALEPAEARRFEALLTANPDASVELARFNEVAAAMAMAGCPPLTPPPGLRSRILEQVAPRPPTAGLKAVPPDEPPSSFRFVMNDGSGWQPGPLPGLRVKLLSVSRDMGYRVVMAELAPGARFPEHDHQSSEELLVLSGHLHTEGRVLGPGDFLHAEPGTHHHELVSPDGCIALLIDRAPAQG